MTRQMGRNAVIPLWQLLAWTAVVAVGWVPSASAGESNEVSIQLRSTQDAVTRLAPGATTGSASFVLDAAGTICVQIVAVDSDQNPFGNLTTSIEGPAGQTITPANVAGFGGSYGDFEGADGPDGALVIATSQPGHHYLYMLPFLGPGAYTVYFSAPGITDDVAVVTEILTDSPVAVNLVATQAMVTTGTSVVLVAAVFEGASPLIGASVVATVTPPDLSEFTVNLLDDGQDADDDAGDGLYSGTFTANAPGPYLVSATVQGSTLRGVDPFERNATTAVEAVVPGAAFTEDPFNDFGQDDNANGRFERLVIEAPVNVAEADEYGLTVRLRTPGGQVLLARGRAVPSRGLLGGEQTIAATISAEALRAADEDGPYTIEGAELIRFTLDGVQPAGLLENGTQQTQAYLLGQFDRPGIELTGVNADFGVDQDADTDFDVLLVNLGIDVLTAGTYNYSARLVSSCGSEIEFLAGTQAFAAPGAGQPLTLVFDGSRIGAHGVDGTFGVRDMVVFGPGGSLVEVTVADTSAYAAAQFDGFTDGDCDDNGLADACEIFLRTARDCDRNRLPDGCDIANGVPDCNADAILDICVVPDAYRLDDATHDSSIGFVGGGDMIWLNQYTVTAGAEVLREISVAWGANVPDGSPTTVMLYDDPNNDGDPNDAVLLTTASVLSSNADLDVLTRVPVTPTNVGNPGDSFFVGAFVSHGNNVFPASLDNNSILEARSWITGGPVGSGNINNLASNPYGVRPVEQAGFPGNWLLRARTIADCDDNLVPDQCQPDCNANFLADVCDLAGGVSQDCNANAVPDECDIAGGTDPDVNENAIPDSCEACAAPLGNGDAPPTGVIDLADHDVLVGCLLGPLGPESRGPCGAAAADCKYDGPDTVQPHDGQQPPARGQGGCGVMDFNGDCNVDLRDVARFYRVFGESTVPAQACCLDDGSCFDAEDAAACDAADGTAQGPGTICGTTVCPAPRACCFSDGSCDNLLPAECTSQDGTSQTEGSACATTVCPFGRYSNTTSLVGQIQFFQPGVNGFESMADDLTLAGTLRDLVRYDIAVFGGGGGAFDVSTGIYTDCSAALDTLVPGTEMTWPGVPDDGVAHVLTATPTGVTIPDTVWLVVQFSTDQAAWIIAGQAEVGSTANVFGLSPGGNCNASFGAEPHAGFYAELTCE